MRRKIKTTTTTKMDDAHNNNNSSITNVDWTARLSSLLLSYDDNNSYNQVEAQYLSDAIVSQVQEEYLTQCESEASSTLLDDEQPVRQQSTTALLLLLWKSALKEYLCLTDEQSEDAMVKLGLTTSVNSQDDDEQQNDEKQETTNQRNDDDDDVHDDADDDDDDDDDEMVGEGECELCDRYLRLTRHHLIPKSTWPRILPLLQRATEVLVQDEKNGGGRDIVRAKMLLGPGLEHLIPRLLEQHVQNNNHTTVRSLKRIVSHQTCLICPPCHRAVHKAHDNMTLARDYNTIEQLLQDENIYKFCKWASQQKPGRYAIK